MTRKVSSNEGRNDCRHMEQRFQEQCERSSNSKCRNKCNDIFTSNYMIILSMWIHFNASSQHENDAIADGGRNWQVCKFVVEAIGTKFTRWFRTQNSNAHKYHERSDMEYALKDALSTCLKNYRNEILKTEDYASRERVAWSRHPCGVRATSELMVTSNLPLSLLREKRHPATIWEEKEAYQVMLRTVEDRTRMKTSNPKNLRQCTPCNKSPTIKVDRIYPRFGRRVQHARVLTGRLTGVRGLRVDLTNSGLD